MDITRRGFFFGAAAVAASTALGGDEVDGNLTVFLSDIHISGKDVKGQPTYQNPLLDKAIDQILALRPRPRRAVVFGDVALWRGHAADYAESAPRLKRLSDAGIEVTVTTGNHDHRVPMFAAYPEQAKKTPVPGRVTSVVDLGTSDLFLLDSLNENAAGEGSNNAVAGTLDEAQAAWLKGAAAAAKRPFFVGAHHPPEELLVPPLVPQRLLAPPRGAHRLPALDGMVGHDRVHPLPHVPRPRRAVARARQRLLLPQPAQAGRAASSRVGRHRGGGARREVHLPLSLRTRSGAFACENPSRRNWT